jgi:sodium/bile acid cotransporter 7
VPIPAFLRRLPVDGFTIALVATVAVASILPVSGNGARAVDYLIDFAIGAMFFLYGARLSREAVLGGMTNWRLHLLVFASTFVLFPALGLAAGAISPRFLTPDLYLGVLYLCMLPSTVQSSIAFTSIARGNVAAAIVSASASNLIGIFLTPILVVVLMRAHGMSLSLHSIGAIVLQLLLPFLAGQLARPWIAGWAARNSLLLSFTDRGSVLLVVYGAFSAAVAAGIWRTLSPLGLATMAVADGTLLALVLIATTFVSRRLGFSREDEIAIVFCGSKKSLASGVPMANILFAGHAVGMIVLPLMLFHQIQLMVCAALARRYAKRALREADFHSPAGPRLPIARETAVSQS